MNSTLYAIVKIIVTAIIIFLISEIAKKYSLFAGIIASLPLTSILAMIWLYIDKRNPQSIIQLSWDIFYMVIPSLAFFVSLPLILKWSKSFVFSMIAAGAITSGAYYVWFRILKYFNIV